MSRWVKVICIVLTLSAIAGFFRIGGEHTWFDATYVAVLTLNVILGEFSNGVGYESGYLKGRFDAHRNWMMTGRP
jgi:hypothetical protein